MLVPYRNDEAKPSDRSNTKRWLAAYSVAAAGGVVATDADAAVIPMQLPGGEPIVVETPDPGSTEVFLDLDIDGDGVNDFRLLSYLGAEIFDINFDSDNGVVLDYMAPEVRFLTAGVSA
ncbi:MAG: hypothetical protein AAF266_16150 [Planctomycetota bacterium]